MIHTATAPSTTTMRPWPSYRRQVQRLSGDPRIAWPALRERGRGPPDEAGSSTEIEEEHRREGVARGFPGRAPGPTSERNPNDKGVGSGFLRGRKNAFSTEICAENLRRAVEFAAKRYPGRAVGLRFPLDPEAFFAEGSSLGMETSGLVTGYREPSSVETGMPEYTGSAVAPSLGLRSRPPQRTGLPARR